MRLPLEWLYEYCRPGLELEQLADRLTLTGTNVESIEHHGVGELDKFVVGRVLQAERHPNADRLSVCLVDIGGGEQAKIVCGAPNVAAGQTVAVARPGAVMPDGTRLKAAKLRGVESEGMILAEDELAIGTDHEGILVLEPDGLEPGTSLREVMPLATEVLDLEITSNRPDCLAVYGIAREVHAATGAPLSPPPWSEDPGTQGDIEDVSIRVEDPDLCPRFTARVFEEVKIGPSPPWLKARLMASGQRPISNVVDITNYVMLLTGQPLHAFDLDQVAGQTLTVRRATAGEPVRTLDGQTRKLDDEMVLIADADGPTSIAGVMGGERSEVSETTTRVLMEAATWDGPNIHRTAWTLGLQSEASLRFEKQLQPEQTMWAQAVAAQLMIDLCGARLASGTIDIGGEGPPPVTISLREARVTQLLGVPIARERCAEIMQALEFATYANYDGLDVQPPAFRRGDVMREVDVIEEVARIDGLDKLPATLPSRHGADGRLTPRQRLRRRAADALAVQGLHESVGWSFTSPEVDGRLRRSHQAAIELQNPLSSEQSRLRTELLSSLLEVARHNRARGAATIRLFETGAVYLPRPGEALPREPYHVAALLIGAVRPATWRHPQPPRSDFFAAKGVLAGLFDSLHVSWSVEETEEPFLHPGRAASILIEGERAGWLGEVHPLVTAEWELDDPVAAFELDLDLVPDPQPIIYEDVLTFPAVREDLAVVVPEGVSATRVIEVVRRTGAPLLRSAEVFDVYRDPERVGEGNVSLALRLSYGAPDRTLTDEEVAAKRTAIAQALTDELGGRIRAG
ncbi:MAG TPA: phenylalanine--tRNA ligase subunit beta [Solirubrobacteraceae bacterium]|nr:phenylalanine--tRNA ligase subunit beta [Solirubrobacteraceae bacterium]